MTERIPNVFGIWWSGRLDSCHARLLPVLPFLDPVVRPVTRVHALADHGDVIPLGLHGHTETPVRSEGHVDVEQGELRHAALEDRLRRRRGSFPRRTVLELVAPV